MRVACAGGAIVKFWALSYNTAGALSAGLRPLDNHLG